MRRNDFSRDTEDYYDLYEDYGLIEASFSQQYGIRLRQEEDMSWNEFCTLLSGLLPDTPLGRIVSIRAEKDPKVIKNFTTDQKKIRNDWQRRKLQRIKEDPEAYQRYMDKFQAFCKAAFSSQ